MNAAAWILPLALCVSLPAWLQLAEHASGSAWRGLWLLAALLAALLVLCAATASGIGAGDLQRWLQDPQRRQDLAALFLLEGLLYGRLVLHAADAPAHLAPRPQHDASGGAPSGHAPGIRRLLQHLRRQLARPWHDWLAWLPPPSFLLAQFLLLVFVMLHIDGIDYHWLAIGVALLAALLMVGLAGLLRLCLPLAHQRRGMRLLCHALLCAAALWLSGPSRTPAVTDAPAAPVSHILIPFLIAAALALAGAAWHRLFSRRTPPWNR